MLPGTSPDLAFGGKLVALVDRAGAQAKHPRAIAGAGRVEPGTAVSAESLDTLVAAFGRLYVLRRLSGEKFEVAVGDKNVYAVTGKRSRRQISDPPPSRCRRITQM